MTNENTSPEIHVSETRHATADAGAQKVTSFHDIHMLMSEADEAALANNQKNYSNTYEVVTLMMYLTGVEERHFTEHRPDFAPRYNALDKIDEARIIRALNIVRTSIMRNFLRIVNQFRYEMKNLSTIPDLVPTEAVEELERQGIRIQNTRPDAMNYQIAINNEMSNRINNVKYLFPEWVKWDYIRPLFIMPNGTKPEGVKAAADFYNSDRNRYPYQRWMNWNRDTSGNLFRSDYKFMTELYAKNNDVFEDRSLIKGTNTRMLDDLYGFIGRHERVLMVVDCENSDPIKLAAALSSLSSAQQSSIRKILLFDSDYTTAAWETLCNTDVTRDFETEHIVVPRLYEHKSMVDMTLAVSTSKEVYQNGVDAVLLVSSDSDYWALIKSLPDIDFLVMLEKMKSGQTIRETLESSGYHYCFIDDFCTSSSYSIKTKTVLAAIRKRVDAMASFNIREMLDEELRSSWLSMTDKEKKNLFDRHLKTMRLKMDMKGNVRIIIE